MVNIYAKFHSNPFFTNGGTIAAHKMCVNEHWTDGRKDGRMDRQLENVMLSSYHCLLRHKNRT